MKRRAVVAVLGVLMVSLTGCGSDSAGGAASTQVGPVSFELPEGIQEVYRDAEREGGWVAEYADDQESAGAFIGVWRFRETPPSATHAATEMIAQVRASGTHPGIRTREDGKVDIPGSEDASIINFSLKGSGEDITGRWWVLLDSSQDVAVTVEYYGSEVTEEDLDIFEKTLNLDSGQSW